MLMIPINESMQDQLKRLLISANPFSDESFIGYLLRLAELNCYPTVSWILQLARIRSYANSASNAAFDPSFDLQPLSEITGIEENQLTTLLYEPVAYQRGMRSPEFYTFGGTLPRYLIRTERPKICLGCLKEASYIRKIWELAPVTACPIHKSVFLDECPKCNRRISWTRPGISKCVCEFDWREVRAEPLSDNQLAFINQIYKLCNLDGSFSDNRTEGDFNPLYSLDLKNFVTSLLFISGQLAGITDTTGKYSCPSKRNIDVHTGLVAAFEVFENWPDNFFSMIEGIRRQKKKNPAYMTGIKLELGPFIRVLYQTLKSTDFDFLRNALEDYLLTDVTQKELAVYA